MKKYIAIDIETTGLDPDRHTVLEIGAVMDDGVMDLRDLPRFKMLANVREALMQPGAAAFNGGLLKEIADGGGDCEVSQMGSYFAAWLNQVWDEESSIVFAGKNAASFDWPFLKRLKGMERIRPSHRFLDPGMLYWRPEVDGFKTPNLSECLKRAGLPYNVTHRAVDDAEQVVKLIRVYLGGRRVGRD